MPGGDLPDLRGLRLGLAGVPWNSRKSVGRDLLVELVVAVDRVDLDVVEQLDAGDRDSVRETSSTVSTAPSSVANAAGAAAIASGVGWIRSVASQISPSVPSEPMNSRVRS